MAQEPKVHEPEFVWPGKEPDNPEWDNPATHHRRAAPVVNGIYWSFLVGGIGVLWLAMFIEPAFGVVAALYTAPFLWALWWRRRKTKNPSAGTPANRLPSTRRIRD